ncbi:MAG: bifunctional riboflavin kinase/FAD synthetase [Bacteriovoracaceae bacterium]|nr:bifunctional riboflavin kinase/FAD synthetase [Bacteriovoracaceae bacterium]
MKVIETKISQFQTSEEGPFGLTIGNFDGVHLGHQDLLSRVRKELDKKNHKMIVMTFNPHPIKIIKGLSAFLLNTYAERRAFLEKNGVDILIEIHFTRDLSTMAPEKFIDDHILSIPNLETFYLGYDFAFGSNKTGDHKFIQDYCKDKCAVEIQPEYKHKGENISSSKIRRYLQNGNIKEANECLGRDFFISGHVIKGAGRGRQIGIPTANIDFDTDLLVPKRGVYITKSTYRDQVYFSVTNIGINPTFKDDEIYSVETHLLDFDNDIYGDELSISFVERVRDEVKFNSVNELVSQIKADIETAKKYFKND